MSHRTGPARRGRAVVAALTAAVIALAVSLSAASAAGTGFEICVNGADTCKAGTSVGPALGGEFTGPPGVATDAASNVYVADRGNNRIQKFDSSGNFQRAWGEDVVSAGPGNTGTGYEICVAGVDTCKAGTTVGVALGGEMNIPYAVATDAATNVYVADLGNNRIQKFDSSGGFLATWGRNVDSVAAGTGLESCTLIANCKAADVSTGLGGEMDIPFAVATDADANVYVADSGNNRIQKFDSSGDFLATWGRNVDSVAAGTGLESCTLIASCKAADASTGLGGEMNQPIGVATDAAANVYVGDQTNHRIQKFDSSGGFLATWGRNVDNAGGTGGLETCSAIASCKAADASTGLGGEMNQPMGVATDAVANVYVADITNNRIQKFDSSGDFLATWGRNVDSVAAGTGLESCTLIANCKAADVSTGLGGEMFAPFGVATDAAANVYVGDNNNHRIQKFDSSGGFLRTWGEDVINDPPDTTAPNTALGSAKIKRAARKATFKFSSTEPGSTFLCKIDKKSFAACSSPKTYKRVKRGKHKFQVKARDAAGNLDGSPVVKKFRI